MRKFGIIIIVGLIGLALTLGCAKRRNPLIVVTPSGSLLTFPDTPADIFSTALSGNKLKITDASGKLTLFVYLPVGHPAITVPPPPPPKQKYPVLYLLADFDQTSEDLGKFYQLEALTDKLLADGEIDSLVVVIIGGDAQATVSDIGGIFYGNNYLVGDWWTYVNQQLIPALDTFYLQVSTDTTRRAIAGLGMGGYGAFRIALENPARYKVVGALSAPLALGGTDPAGWLETFLRPNVMTENGNNYGSIFAAAPYDKSKPITSLMVAMASAFSPHDTTVDTTTTPYYRTIENTIPNYGIDLPFDGDSLLTPIVTRWMAQDIENLLNTTKSGALAGKKIYFDCGDADEFEYDAINDRFDAFLTGKGITHTYEKYSGYTGHPATHNDFAYDRLKELFRFVSASM